MRVGRYDVKTKSIYVVEGAIQILLNGNNTRRSPERLSVGHRDVGGRPSDVSVVLTSVFSLSKTLGAQCNKLTESLNAGQQ